MVQVNPCWVCSSGLIYVLQGTREQTSALPPCLPCRVDLTALELAAQHNVFCVVSG